MRLLGEGAFGKALSYNVEKQNERCILDSRAHEI